MANEETSSTPDGRETDRLRLINRVLSGRYEVLELVGDGPLLTAFRVRDRQMNRIVALKALRSEYEARVPLQQTLRNGFSEVLGFQHPAIARYYDVGGDSELTPLYVVEEFVRGIDLKERIRRGAPFQLTAATDIAIAIAEALEYMHGRGVPHGDLCPQHILISSPENQVKLTGLGVAVAYSQITAENPALLMRTVPYAAPDLATSTMPTGSADLYALAVIVYEMLTGDVPFRGDNPVQIALRHAQETPLSPRDLNQAVPRALEGIVLKGLGKRPQDRYNTATELLQDLRAVREALRFGRSLAWSPLDQEDKTIGAPPANLPPPTPVNVMPIGAAAAPTPEPVGRRVSQPVVPVVAPPTPPPTEPTEEPTPRPRGGNGRVWLAVNLFLVLALVLTVAQVFRWIQPYLMPAGDLVVPELRGKTLTEAKALANERHFKLDIIDRQYRDTPPENVIYQQKEIPGDRIREGKTVSVWVSLGPQMVVLPAVVDMTQEKAQKELEKVGLRLGTITREFHPITPTGVVLDQIPRADGVERRPRGTKIDLVISKGPEPEPTPSPEPSPAPNSSNGNPDEPLDAGTVDPDDMKERAFRFEYETPRDGQQHHVRVEVEDANGVHTGYDDTHGPGKSVEAEVSGQGRPIIIRLYDNDVLKKQRVAIKGKQAP